MASGAFTDCSLDNDILFAIGGDGGIGEVAKGGIMAGRVLTTVLKGVAIDVVAGRWGRKQRAAEAALYIELVQLGSHAASRVDARHTVVCIA